MAVLELLILSHEPERLPNGPCQEIILSTCVSKIRNKLSVSTFECEKSLKCSEINGALIIYPCQLEKVSFVEDDVIWLKTSLQLQNGGNILRMKTDIKLRLLFSVSECIYSNKWYKLDTYTACVPALPLAPVSVCCVGRVCLYVYVCVHDSSIP